MYNQGILQVRFKYIAFKDLYYTVFIRSLSIVIVKYILGTILRNVHWVNALGVAAKPLISLNPNVPGTRVCAIWGSMVQKIPLVYDWYKDVRYSHI